jgi:hypothetical protein
MNMERKSKVVIPLIIVTSLLPLLGTTIFKQYAAVLWGATILLGLFTLAIVIPQNSLTLQSSLRSWLLILTVLAIFCLVVFLIAANL